MRTGWRTFLVRTPVVVTLALIALVAILYQWWTNPHAVRQMLLDKLGENFVGATVRVESAQLRLLGGISFNELRMSRREGLDSGDFLYVPSGIIYHDKEKLLGGSVGIRKLELNRPRVRIVRDRDGSINLQNVLAIAGGDERIPTMVLHQATILIEDRGASPGAPLLELQNLDISLVNDPLPTVQVVGRGGSDILGPLRFKATVSRDTETVQLSGSLDRVPITAELIQRIGLLAPSAVEHVQGLRGNASLEGEFQYDPRSQQSLGFDLRGKMEKGTLTHPRLPMNVEQLGASFRISNRVTPEPLWPRSPLGIYVPNLHVSARSGGASLEIDAVGIAVPDRLDLNDENALCTYVEGKLEHLDVTEKVTGVLPPHLQNIEHDFQPRGPVTISHTFRRLTETDWQSNWQLTHEGGTARFHEYPYPLQNIRGTMERVETQERKPITTYDVTVGMAQERVVITGTMTGDDVVGLDLKVVGANLISEDALIEALPPKPRSLAREFQPRGRFGIEFHIQKDEGSLNYRNRYTFRFHDGTFTYVQFPYPLRQVTGELEVRMAEGRADWEARKLRGQHEGAEIHIEARNVPAGKRLDQWSTSQLVPPVHPSIKQAPVRTAEAMQIRLRGTGVPINRQLEAAISPPMIPGRSELQKAWHTMNPTGTLDFTAEVVDLVGLPNGLTVGLKLQGVHVQPRFFAVPLDGLDGLIYYGHNRVDLIDIQGKTNPGQIRLPEGVVYLKPNGGYQVRLGRLQVWDTPATEAFLRALPGPLRKTLEAIQFRGTFNITTALVLETGEGSNPPSVWWDGGMGLRDGSVNLGVPLTGITGQLSCTGQHNGQAIEVAFGNLLLDQVTLLKQPIRTVQGAFEIPREQPNRLQLRNFKGTLFGGILAGEGHLRFAPNLQYDLMLKALQVNLESFGRHNFSAAGAELQGLATAALHLKGEGSNLSDLRGNGRVDIPNGRLYRLPWMLDLLKTISLRVPDQTAFESARATFAIEGPRVEVEELKLVGNPVSLRGDGTFDLDGSNLALDFTVDWGTILPPGFKALPSLVIDQLFKIKVRGKIDQVHYERELIPSMVTPLKQAIRGN